MSISLKKIFRGFFKKFDIFLEIGYNGSMKTYTIAIIGGGASGLMLAASMKNTDNVALFERSDRLGRKLSATGNGQGNITNLAVKDTAYFSVDGDGRKAKEILRRYDDASMRAFFENLGLLLISDERGRVYPAGRQASAVTDALRYAVSASGVDAHLGVRIEAIERVSDGFLLTSANGERYLAKTVAICTGGKAAPNFGTDGSAYDLARSFGHTVTPLYPSLVQLKTDTTYIKTLKGIRVNDGRIRVRTGKGEVISFVGDVIFTDYGVSGDAVFRASAFIASETQNGTAEISIDFLPQFEKSAVLSALFKKRATYPDLSTGELLCGMVNNQIGRAIFRRANNDVERAADLVKNFPLRITGSLGFEYAQVTKGGIPLKEVDENLQSLLVSGLYFAGEILDVDGQCGGFNLQWAYASARAVAEAIAHSKEKRA